MKNIIIPILSIILLSSCSTRPKNFTYEYQGTYTGLDKRIDINGYYVSQRGCDPAFFSMYMFYPDGLFSIATTSQISPELIDCFENGGSSNACHYPLWGTYILEGDLIRTQVIRKDGSACVIFRDYRIMPDKSIVNVSDYVQPSYTILGYMENYPSITENLCEKAAIFYPLTSQRDISECPFVKKK